jgi:predicted 2-oxoglutarate/Fe(II)-dependent dioxygenase YbiX
MFFVLPLFSAGFPKPIRVRKHTQGGVSLMTPKQILDSFSETLMQDERILSARERALLATLLQHAKSNSGDNQQTREAVRTVMASAVGETVAQRAFAVLGGSIVERILESSTWVGSEVEGNNSFEARPTGAFLKTEPQPPGKQPEPPGVVRPPQAPLANPPSPQPEPPGVKHPHKPAPKPLRDTPSSPGQPEPPGVKTPPAPQPEPPHGTVSREVVASTNVGVIDRPAVLPAKCVVLDEFLAPSEVAELMQFAIEHESEFKASEVVSADADSGMVNHEHRRSRVLMDVGQYEDILLERIKTVLPQVLRTLEMEEFPIAGVEAQITASNHGDVFHFHSDNGSEPVASRHLTFVYFFHREPRQFEGGELRIHDARLEGDAYASDGSYQTIVPQQNQIVFFPCELLHEITPVKCSSQHFADSRFTLNGWLRR